MFIVYVAGRYRVYNEDGTFDLEAMKQEVDNEHDAAVLIAECGLMPFCPLANSVHLEGEVDWGAHQWIDGDLDIIRALSKVSGAIYMRYGWAMSEGANQEYTLAKSLGMKIIFGDSPRAGAQMLSLSEVSYAQ